MVLLNWFALITMVCMVVITFFPKLSLYISKSRIGNNIVKLCQRVESKYFKQVVTILMFIGVAVRLWKFGIIPAGFNQDGAMGAVDALALAHHGTDRFGMWLPVHFTAWGFGQMSVLLSYISVPFIAAFGLNRFTARIPVVIISILAIWVIYRLSKLLFGKRIALFILFFLCIKSMAYHAKPVGIGL